MTEDDLKQLIAEDLINHMVRPNGLVTICTGSQNFGLGRRVTLAVRSGCLRVGGEDGSGFLIPIRAIVSIILGFEQPQPGIQKQAPSRPAIDQGQPMTPDQIEWITPKIKTFLLNNPEGQITIYASASMDGNPIAFILRNVPFTFTSRGCLVLGLTSDHDPGMIFDSAIIGAITFSTPDMEPGKH